MLSISNSHGIPVYITRIVHGVRWTRFNKDHFSLLFIIKNELWLTSSIKIMYIFFFNWKIKVCKMIFPIKTFCLVRGKSWSERLPMSFPYNVFSWENEINYLKYTKLLCTFNFFLIKTIISNYQDDLNRIFNDERMSEGACSIYPVPFVQ